jgi:uncharacterized membrane protein
MGQFLMENDYKRELDAWIKVMVVVSPLLGMAVTWGVVKSEMSSMRSDIAEIKGWKDAQMEKSVASARETGEIIAQLESLNEKMANKQIVHELKDLNVKMGDVRNSVQKKLK